MQFVVDKSDINAVFSKKTVELWRVMGLDVQVQLGLLI